MIDRIVELIRIKTENNPNSALFTQWNASRDYVFQTLNAISHMFPHYSLHDISHSEAILTNIERIVGKETLENKFSAEDLWLLLCSACYHDLGMFVSGEDKKNLMQDGQFIEHVNKIQNDEKSYLHTYAIHFETKGDTLIQKETPIEDKTINALNFLIADFIRKKHSERSEEEIMKDKNLALHFVPERMKQILGLICKSHTADFKDVMLLPYEEKGIYVDDCHPRYIACLLRLGDLLDMDNNRFSNVILSTLPSIPIDSLQHKAKHFSVTHLEINSKRISATATCDDVEVADLTQKWFSMLNEEVKNQMMKWSDIVPNDTSFGFLPTIGELSVKLFGYDTIDGKFKNKFYIEPINALEMIQGAGLYNSKFQSIREILQNAVDATLLRIFIDKEADWSSFSETKKRESFRAECKKYPITIRLSKKEHEDNDLIDWNISIEDNGIGMSKDDIKMLLQTANGDNKIHKTRIIQRMPEWMKPSGTFGIGFQSIFLLTDVVDIETHKYNKEQTYILKLYNPIKEKEGLVLLHTVTPDRKIKVGTEVSLSIRVKAHPTSWSVNAGQNTGWNVINNYDFIKDTSFDIEIAKIIDEIIKFSQVIETPIIIKEGEQIIFQSKQDREILRYFSERENIDISLQFGSDIHRYVDTTLYRGQKVDKSIRDLKFMSFVVNILGGDAKDILTLNRNEIRNDYRSQLKGRIINAAKEYLFANYIGLSDEEKEWASMFILYYTGSSLTQKEQYKFSAWKKHVIKLENKEEAISFENILKCNRIILREKYASTGFVDTNRHHFPFILRNDADESMIIICYEYNSDDIFFLQKMILEATNYYSSINSYNENGKEYIELIYSKQKPVDVINNLRPLLSLYMQSNNYARGYLPCMKKYKTLEVNIADDAYVSGVFVGYFLYGGPIMVSPYIRKHNEKHISELSYELCDNQLYQYVYEHRKNLSVTLEEIVKTYEMFYDDTKNLVESLNKNVNKDH